MKIRRKCGLEQTDFTNNRIFKLQVHTFDLEYESISNNFDRYTSDYNTYLEIKIPLLFTKIA